MLRNILYVGLGGAVGSIARYLGSVWVNHYFLAVFPWATFLVNVLGCLIAGLLFSLFNQNPNGEPLRLLLLVGFCGGFTTFSSFALENLRLFQNNHDFIFVLYTLLSIFVGYIAVFLGLSIHFK